MYLFYIDETGNTDPDISKGKDFIFVLSAIGIFDQNWKAFYSQIISKKLEFVNRIFQTTGVRLPISDCEVKSNWIRIKKEREKRYFLKNLTNEELEDLVSVYFKQLEYHKLIFFSIVIDKREMLDYMDQEKIYKKSWELLCERIELYMKEKHNKHMAVLITDDVSKKNNTSLALKHSFFLRSSTSAELKLNHIVEMPMFASSELSEGVQLADLCSYSIYHVFKYQKTDYAYFKKIAPYLYNSCNTTSDKYDGLKIFPAKSTLVEFCRKCFIGLGEEDK